MNGAGSVAKRASSLAAVVLGIVLAALAIGARARDEAVRGEAVRSAAVEARVPGRSPTNVVADDRGALAEVLMHWVPELSAPFRETYEDFLGTLPEPTRVLLVTQRGRAAAAETFVGEIARGCRSGEAACTLPSRTRIVEIPTPLGMWSRDRALVVAPSAADAGSIATTLLVPARPTPDVRRTSRPEDWPVVPALVAAMPDRFALRELPLFFDGGDFAAAGDRLLVDVNLLARNRVRGLGSAADLRGRLRALLGRDVVVLGAEEGDVPRHHMSMYMAPLDVADDATGKPVVLVGDPREAARLVGDDFVPGEVGFESGAPLRADARPSTVARFDRVARELEAAGFEVVRIPAVAFDDKTYFAYTNGVYETRRTVDGPRRTAWMPVFGVPALDDAARAVYERLGWRVVPVRVRSIYAQHGTLGCLVNVVARGTPREP